MRKLLLIILLLSFAQQAHAIQAFSTGSILLEECEAHVNKTSVAKGNICVGYVAGMSDIYTSFVDWKLMDKGWCLPKDMMSDQLVRVVVKHLQGHPEELHMTAGSLVSNAFYVAFPCGEGE